MASYRIEWRRSAKKELKKLHKGEIQKIIAVVESLAENPFPEGSKKLVGSEHTYRVREGDYRILYDVIGQTLLIEIIKVGHRKDVYKVK